MTLLDLFEPVPEPEPERQPEDQTSRHIYWALPETHPAGCPAPCCAYEEEAR